MGSYGAEAVEPRTTRRLTGPYRENTSILALAGPGMAGGGESEAPRMAALAWGTIHISAFSEPVSVSMCRFGRSPIPVREGKRASGMCRRGSRTYAAEREAAPERVTEKKLDGRIRGAAVEYVYGGGDPDGGGGAATAGFGSSSTMIMTVV
jgi:hypothetical protein